MSKRLILILALAFVVGIAVYAYAEVQNVKVSGDLTIQGVARNSLILRDNTALADYGESISAILSTARVRIDADLTDNVSTTVRLLNEREWGEESSSTTDVDLDLAYVTLKEFLYSPLTLTLGRQELKFGNALIIGDPDTNGVAAGHNATATTYVGFPNSLDDLSSRKAFDAIRATLNYDPLVVDLVYSKIDENSVAAYNDVDLYGVNAGYAVNKDLHTEAYLWQRNRDVGNTGIALGTKPEKLSVVGAKGMYTGIENVILGLEGAYQFGNHINDTTTTLYPDDNINAPTSRKVNAYAIQAVASYALPKGKRFSPTIGGSYTYLSGAKWKSISDNYTGWDAMFEDQGGGTLNNKIAAASNSQAFNINGSIKPTDDLTAKLDYTYIRLVQPYTGATLTSTLSGAAGDPSYTMKANKKYFGSEVGLDLTYDYTEDVQFGLNTGAFIPGSAFDKTNKKTATQVIGSMKVTF